MVAETNYLKLGKSEPTDEILGTLNLNNKNFDVIDEKTKEIDEKLKYLEENGGTSGGDIIVLEASADNIIDFNNIYQDGVYLIKNINHNTVLNVPLTTGWGNEDYRKSWGILHVEVSYMVDDGTIGMIYQKFYAGIDQVPYYRTSFEEPAGFFPPEEDTVIEWYDWTNKIQPSSIMSGVLAQGMSCKTPTIGSHLANKEYVDSVIGSSGGECNIPKYVGTAGNPIDFGELYEKEFMNEDGTHHVGSKSGKCFLEGYVKVGDGLLSIGQFQTDLIQFLYSNTDYIPKNFATLDEITMGCEPILVDYIYLGEETDVGFLVVFDAFGAKIPSLATPYSGFESPYSMLELTKPAIDTENILFKNNTTEYTPTGNYHPATKKYVDDKITYGTEDLTAGTSELATGTVYFVYE